MCVKILEKIYTNLPLTKVPYKERKLEDHEIREFIDVKRGRLTLEEGDERIKSKLEKLIRNTGPKPPPQVQKYEPPHKRNKKKGMDMRYGLISGHGNQRRLKIRSRSHSRENHHEC